MTKLKLLQNRYYLLDQELSDHLVASIMLACKNQVCFDFLISLGCIDGSLCFWIIFGFAMVLEYLLFIDLIHFLLGGIIPSTVAIQLIQFQGMFVVSWDLIAKLVCCRSPNLSDFGLVDSSS